MYRFSEKEQQLINLMVDDRKNKPLTVFSTKEARKEAINAQFFEILGTTTPNEMDLDDHKRGLFAIIQEVAKQTIALGDGTEASLFYSKFVTEESIGLGDTKEIEIENDSYLTVGRISGNNWNLKRERVDKGAVITVKTDAFYVGCYEYMKRIITGRANFSDLLDKVTISIRKHKDDFIANKFGEAISGIPTPYKYKGAYNDTEILKVISRVKAANKGTRVTLVGTVEALSKLQMISNIGASDSMLDEINQSGFLGKWKGHDCLALPTVYKADSEDFVFDPNVIYVLPSDSKLIRVINRGEPIVKETAMAWQENMDMSVDYYVIWQMGAVVLFNKLVGRLEITE